MGMKAPDETAPADEVAPLTVEELLALPVSVTIEHVARALNIGRTTAYRAAAADSLPVPVIRIGRRMIVRRMDLLNLLGVVDPAKQCPHCSTRAEAAAA